MLSREDASELVVRADERNASAMYVVEAYCGHAGPHGHTQGMAQPRVVLEGGGDHEDPADPVLAELAHIGGGIAANPVRDDQRHVPRMRRRALGGHPELGQRWVGGGLGHHAPQECLLAHQPARQSVRPIPEVSCHRLDAFPRRRGHAPVAPVEALLAVWKLTPAAMATSLRE